MKRKVMDLVKRVLNCEKVKGEVVRKMEIKNGFMRVRPKEE